MRSIKYFIAALMLGLASVSFAAEKVNINTADAATIAENLKGIGEAKAKAIIEYRKANGGFKTVDELTAVKGIGEKTVDANRTLIVLSKK